MSPSEAPESEEPNWAIASFSSATSSALIDNVTRRALRSNWVTRASSLSPTEKRSGRWSARVACELGAADEGAEISIDDLDVDAGILHFHDLAGHDLTLADLTRIGEGNRRRAALMPSEMRSLSTSTSSTWARTMSPFLNSSMTCSPGTVPVEIRQVDHAVDIAFETDEQTEFGLVLDLALDLGTDGMLLGEGLPRILAGSA